jgi:hypothetical protein
VAVFILVSIALSFAALVTAHVALAVGLGLRTPWTRGLVAFVVPPMAPYWGLREKMRGRSVAWLVALALYVAARVAAQVMAKDG